MLAHRRSIGVCGRVCGEASGSSPTGPTNRAVPRENHRVASCTGHLRLSAVALAHRRSNGGVSHVRREALGSSPTGPTHRAVPRENHRVVACTGRLQVVPVGVGTSTFEWRVCAGLRSGFRFKSYRAHPLRLPRAYHYADPMNDKQGQKPSCRHFSTIPLWAKLGLILAVIVVSVVCINIDA